MKILFVTSECAPFSKSGGLADVAFSLPPALKRAGNEVAIITPLYRCVRAGFEQSLVKVKNCRIRLGQSTIPVGLYRGERDGVTVWFVDYAPFFNRPKLYGYDDDKLRFAKWGKQKIAYMLAMKHIDRSVINDALDNIDDEEYALISNNNNDKKLSFKFKIIEFFNQKI